MKPSRDFEDLLDLVARLRKECPWDRQQTHDSIKDHLIEEAHEVIDAIDRKSPEDLKKELGDLLLHVLFHSQMASESDNFTMRDVIHSLSDKMIRRHPHVFGEESVKDDQQLAQNWESLKMEEGKRSVLDGLPPSLPALIQAQRMQEKAGNVGFDWEEWPQAWEKLLEEIEEWRAEIDGQDEVKRMAEFGDLLFSMVNVGRLLGLQAENSLRHTNRKFERRFRYLEKKLQEAGKSLSDTDLAEMEILWNEAKKYD